MFPATPSGNSATLFCAAGYNGSPTRTCDLGNWGVLSNGCVCTPVNGGWSAWMNDGSCGQYQPCKQKQARSCTSPAPSCGGTSCSGPLEQYVDCGCTFCGVPPVCMNSTVQPGGNNPGDQRLVVCNAGYTGMSSTFTCNSGNWAGSCPTCTPASVKVTHELTFKGNS